MEPAEITAANNLKVEYLQLMREMPIKQKELTDSIVQAREELDRIKIEKRTAIEEADEKLTELKEKQAIFNEAESKSKQEKRVTDEEHAKVKKELKENLKELTRLNSYVLAAREELTKVTIEVTNANEQLKHLVLLVAKVEETKVVLHDLQEKKAVILQEISTEKEALDSKIRSTADILAAMKLEMVETQKKSDIAQATLKTYTDELYTAMNDYHIVRTRLEDKWKMTFPELELPLML